MDGARRTLLPALLVLAGCGVLRPEGTGDPHAAAVRALGSRSAAERARAAGDLERAGEDAVPALLEALSAGGERERYAAVRILGKIGAGARDAVPRLVGMLKGEELSIPLSLAEALGGIGAPAVPALLELARDPEETNRYWAIHALGGMPAPVPPEALAALTEALGDASDAVQGRAAIGLVRAGAAAVPPLLRLLLGEDLDRATASAELLERIGTPEARAALAGSGGSAPGEGDQQEDGGQVDQRAP